MLKLRKKIKNNNTDNFINVPLIISNDFVGHQQEINKFTETETNKHINDVNDGETRRFKSNKDFKLNTYFYNEDNESFVNEFQIKGISYEDSNTLTSKYTNSFFIFDFFDSSKPQEQTKIFTTYFTKLNNGNEKNIQMTKRLKIQMFLLILLQNILKFFI